MHILSQQIVDNLLKELTRQSKIVIEYELLIEMNGAASRGIKKISVNKCNSSDEFFERISNISEKIISSYSTEIGSISPRYISDFAIITLEKLQALKGITNTETILFDVKSMQYYFRNPKLHCINNKHNPENSWNLLFVSGPYAKCWNDVLEKTISIISNLNPYSNPRPDHDSPVTNNRFSRNKNIAFKSVKYHIDKTCITDLLNSLKEKEFVPIETDSKEFSKIFNNTKPNNPIKWLTTISDLAYFIKYMHRELKCIEPLGNEIWKVTSTLFVDIDGLPFPSDKFKGQKIPAQFKTLQKIASHLI